MPFGCTVMSSTNVAVLVCVCSTVYTHTVSHTNMCACVSMCRRADILSPIVWTEGWVGILGRWADTVHGWPITVGHYSVVVGWDIGQCYCQTSQVDSVVN